MIENIVGKGENAGYQHFHIFPQCFQKAYYTGSLKVVLVWERVKHIYLVPFQADFDPKERVWGWLSIPINSLWQLLQRPLYIQSKGLLHHFVHFFCVSVPVWLNLQHKQTNLRLVEPKTEYQANYWSMDWVSLYSIDNIDLASISGLRVVWISSRTNKFVDFDQILPYYMIFLL